MHGVLLLLFFPSLKRVSGSWVSPANCCWRDENNHKGNEGTKFPLSFHGQSFHAVPACFSLPPFSCDFLVFLSRLFVLSLARWPSPHSHSSSPPPGPLPSSRVAILILCFILCIRWVDGTGPWISLCREGVSNPSSLSISLTLPHPRPPLPMGLRRPPSRANDRVDQWL